MSRLRRVPQVLLLIETSRAFGRGLAEGIARYAEENGPWSIFFEERGLADPLPKWLKQWRGDGILSRTTRKANVNRLIATGLPVVELYADPQLGVGLVHPDDEAVADLAARHFFDRGLRHFAFFCDDQAAWIDLRQQAFARVLQQHGYSCHGFLKNRGLTSSAGQNRGLTSPARHGRFDDPSVMRWLRKLPKPCGVFCPSDFHAMRVTRACRTSGLMVPEQIAVLGVDNDPVFCGVSFPRLSSIELGSARIGYEAAALLDRLMAGQSPPKAGIGVKPQQVVVRESTDILAIDDADMAKAVRIIREQACQRLRVGDVAEAVGMSRRVFEQRFQRILHRSPKEEFIRVQMERAKMLLATSDMPVATVAKKSGFASLEYFTRAFRRHVGMTARAYRRQHRLPGSTECA